MASEVYLNMDDSALGRTSADNRLASIRRSVQFWMTVELNDDLEKLAVYCGLPPKAAIPRPGETEGWEIRQWSVWAKEHGFNGMEKTTHSHQFTWPTYPNIRIALSTTPGDRRSYVNSCQDLRLAWRRGVGIVGMMHSTIVSALANPDSAITTAYNEEYAGILAPRFAYLTQMSEELKKEPEMNAYLGAIVLSGAEVDFPEKITAISYPEVKTWFNSKNILRIFEGSFELGVAVEDTADLQRVEEETAKALKKVEQDFRISRAQVAERAGVSTSSGRVQLSTLATETLLVLKKAATEMHAEYSAKKEVEKEAKRAEREAAEAERQKNRAAIDNLKSRQFRTEEGSWRHTSDMDEAHHMLREYRTLPQSSLAEMEEYHKREAVRCAALRKNMFESDLPIFDGISSVKMREAEDKIAEQARELQAKQEEIDVISADLDRERMKTEDQAFEIEHLKTELAASKDTVVLVEQIEKDAMKQFYELFTLARQSTLMNGGPIEVVYHVRKLIEYLDEHDRKTTKPATGGA